MCTEERRWPSHARNSKCLRTVYRFISFRSCVNQNNLISGKRRGFRLSFKSEETQPIITIISHCKHTAEQGLPSTFSIRHGTVPVSRVLPANSLISFHHLLCNFPLLRMFSLRFTSCITSKLVEKSLIYECGYQTLFMI